METDHVNQTEASAASDAPAPAEVVTPGAGPVTLELATADDPRLAISIMKGRVCAVELRQGGVTLQFGQARDFRVERVPVKVVDLNSVVTVLREVLACTADLAADLPAGATVAGHAVSRVR